MFQTTNQLCVNPRLNPDLWGVFNMAQWSSGSIGFAERIIIKIYQPGEIFQT
jgi:hypothetical protein